MSVQTYRTLYQWSKSAHRTTLFLMVVLTLVMSFTGSMMKFTEAAVFMHIDLGLMVFIHSTVSPFFSLVLLTMMGSGLGLYFFPTLIKKSLPQTSGQTSSAAPVRPMTPAPSKPAAQTASRPVVPASATPMTSVLAPSRKLAFK